MDKLRFPLFTSLFKRQLFSMRTIHAQQSLSRDSLSTYPGSTTHPDCSNRKKNQPFQAGSPVLLLVPTVVLLFFV
jgi:hypothetical protein